MADDTRDTSAPAAAGTTASNTSSTPKKLPKGMIMGKDGKPCRACNSFASFSTLSKTSLSSASTTLPPNDCPPDVEALGRSSWTLLHSLTATYPTSPTPVDRSNISQFMTLFAKLYPCWVCASDFQDFMSKNKVRTESRDEFGKWMCEAHNDVNRKLGKQVFDCAKWEERWRTGPGDGRCG